MGTRWIRVEMSISTVSSIYILDPYMAVSLPTHFFVEVDTISGPLLKFHFSCFRIFWPQFKIGFRQNSTRGVDPSERIRFVSKNRFEGLPGFFRVGNRKLELENLVFFVFCFNSTFRVFHSLDIRLSKCDGKHI